MITITTLTISNDNHVVHLMFNSYIVRPWSLIRGLLYIYVTNFEKLTKLSHFAFQEIPISSIETTVVFLR